MSGLASPKEERENTGGAAASSNDDGPKERKGGLGRDKAARKFASATQEEREAANSDGKFGYYDMTNKRYVPAFFDMFDGGGQDTRGDTFKGGPLSELLNKIGIDPYGSKRERMFVAPNTSSAIQAAVQGGGSGGGNRPTIRPVLRPDNFMTEAQKEQVVMNQPVGQGYPDMSMPTIAGYTTPKAAGADYPNTSMPAIAGYTAPFTDQMTQPSTLSQLIANQGNADEMRLNAAQESDSAPLMPPPVGMTPSMSGFRPMVSPSQEFAPQGQFSSTAPSITQLGTSDFAIVDYLEKNGIPVTMQNVTQYRQILGG